MPKRCLETVDGPRTCLRARLGSASLAPRRGRRSSTEAFPLRHAAFRLLVHSTGVCPHDPPSAFAHVRPVSPTGCPFKRKIACANAGF